MKTFKKALCVILSVSLLLGVFGISAFAAAETDYTIINPYENVDWAKSTTYNCA